MTNLQLFLSIGIPTLAVLAGFQMNNARMGSVETGLGARIASLDAKIDRVEANLSARFDRVETRLTAIEGDLRQFYRDLGAHEADIANLKSQRRA